MSGKANKAKSSGSKFRPYDVQMIRDFLEHLKLDIQSKYNMLIEDDVDDHADQVRLLRLRFDRCNLSMQIIPDFECAEEAQYELLRDKLGGWIASLNALAEIFNMSHEILERRLFMRLFCDEVDGSLVYVDTRACGPLPQHTKADREEFEKHVLRYEADINRHSSAVPPKEAGHAAA